MHQGSIHVRLPPQFILGRDIPTPLNSSSPSRADSTTPVPRSSTPPARHDQAQPQLSSPQPTKTAPLTPSRQKTPADAFPIAPSASCSPPPAATAPAPGGTQTRAA